MKTKTKMKLSFGLSIFSFLLGGTVAFLNGQFETVFWICIAATWCCLFNAEWQNNNG